MKNIFTKKTILILVGIILLSLTTYLIIKDKKNIKYFDRVELNRSTNNVTDNTDVKFLDSIVHVGLDILEVDSVNVQIRKLPKTSTLDLGDLDLLAHIIGEGNSYIIFIKDNETRNEFIQIISHELIHLKDRDSGKLILFDKYGVIYGDQEWEDGRRVDYNNRPWEISAFERGPILAQEIKEILYKSKYNE